LKVASTRAGTWGSQAFNVVSRTIVSNNIFKLEHSTRTLRSSLSQSEDILYIDLFVSVSLQPGADLAKSKGTPKLTRF
jgi:hypothetical protein